MKQDELAAAIEANVEAFLISMGSAGGGLERRDDEVRWTVGGSPIDYHNAVVRCGAASPARADALIAAFVAELRARAVPGCWHVSPSMRPPDLRDRLVAAGFADGGSEPAMAADLGAGIVDVPPVEGFTVERVHDLHTLRDYRDVLAAGFGEGPREADWVASVFEAIGVRGQEGWHHYVGRTDGVAVSTASVLITRNVAGIYFVATHPDERGRGLGTAITHHAMNEARGLGSTTAILGSSPMGHHIYQRLGFRDVFSYRLLEWQP